MNNSFSPLTNEEKTTAGAPNKPDKDEGIAITPVPDNVALEIPCHYSLGKHTQVWKYMNAQGQLLFCVCRFLTASGKEDRPLTYRIFKDGSKRWYWKSIDTPRPLSEHTPKFHSCDCVIVAYYPDRLSRSKHLASLLLAKN